LLLNQKNQTILLAILAFYIPALPLILLDYNAGRAYQDSFHGHLPTIMAFVDHLDFSNYESATTPGFHVLIALFAKFISPNIVFLKFISSLITALFTGIFAGLLYERAGRTTTIVLLLPMILSLYFLPDGVWIVPDNLAWLTVAAIILLTVNAAPGPGYYICTGTILMIAVLVRQSNLWLAAVPWSIGLMPFLFKDIRPENKMLHALLSILVTLPAFLVLFYFYHIWGGLVPPAVQVRHGRGMSYCVPAFFLSIFLVYSVFYIPFVMQALKKTITRSTAPFIGSGFCIGFLAAVIPATDFNHEAGRFSGFWNFVRLAPDIGHVSTLLTITSSLGGAMLFSWLLLLKKDLRITILLATVAFTLALIPNTLVLERYFAGFVFILIFLILAGTDKIEWAKLPNKALIGPAVFAVISFMFTCYGLFLKQ
jgi:hypothetical protein